MSVQTCFSVRSLDFVDKKDAGRIQLGAASYEEYALSALWQKR